MLLKVVTVLCVVAALSVVDARRSKHGFMHAPPPPTSTHRREALPDQWFTQWVDHFDQQNGGTWKQRYFVNDQYYQKGGPVFLMLGGEGTANPIWLVENTQMVNYAQQFGALMFLIEHRYYGISQPFGDLSTPNLQFLSSEQALADAAVFHDYAIVQYGLPANTPWISFGGSYSGALSGWLRLKYPHIVIGAVASSAPVQAELDFSQYLDVVTASLTSQSGSTQCVSNIQAATNQLQQLLQSGAFAQLSSMFNTCSPLSGASQLDLTNFVSSLAGNFEGVVQYNRDNRAFEGAVDTNVTIPVICGLMNDASESNVLQRYANVNSLILQTYGEPCLDFSYIDMITGMQNTTLTAALSGGRQWTYQTCTEFGYYQSSDSSNQPFGSGFPLSFSTQQCTDIYGPEFTLATIETGIMWSLSNYGGYGFAGSNVVFPNGAVDPWHYLSVLSNSGPGITAILIPGTAHCADMYPSSPNDPPELVAARQQVTSLIQSWLTAHAAASKTPTVAVGVAAKPSAAGPKARPHPRK